MLKNALKLCVRVCVADRVCYLTFPRVVYVLSAARDIQVCLRERTHGRACGGGGAEALFPPQRVSLSSVSGTGPVLTGPSLEPLSW